MNFTARGGHSLKEEVIKLQNGTGINVCYSVDRSKEAILFLHFSGGNISMWDGVLPLFEQNYSIIAPDMRGHGKSDQLATGYHIDEMAKDVYLLLEELDVSRCHVVGSSMGAEIGLSLAANYPEIVLSLICEGALYNEFGEYGLFQGNEEEVEKYKHHVRAELSKRKNLFRTEEEFIDVQKEILQEQGIWNEHFLQFFKSAIERTEDGCYTYRYKNHVRKEYIEKYWTIQFEEYYQKVTCPVLFLPSEEESANPIIQNNLKVFSSWLNKSQVRYINNSIHAYVWMQDPKSVVHAVKSFISDVYH
ncbi:alpha/beta hydrolase [Lysinibacillus sp. BW-2-10]|nr:alpha/beta hydrolase [Lysinibacillus sp. BW-2-10]